MAELLSCGGWGKSFPGAVHWYHSDQKPNMAHWEVSRALESSSPQSLIFALDAVPGPR